MLGTLVTEWSPDGREMVLRQPYEFVDEGGLDWPVPSGTHVDGASIPKLLWSILGGPFEGKYRDASAIHDFYCDVHLRTWRATDRAFYEAMLISGVDDAQAKVMYMAVVYGGPRWNDQAIKNTHIGLGRAFAASNKTDKEKTNFYAQNTQASSFESYHDTGVTLPDIALTGSRIDLCATRYVPPHGFSTEHLSRLADYVRRTRPSLDKIDEVVDKARDGDADADH